MLQNIEFLPASSVEVKAGTSKPEEWKGCLLAYGVYHEGVMNPPGALACFAEVCKQLRWQCAHSGRHMHDPAHPETGMLTRGCSSAHAHACHCYSLDMTPEKLLSRCLADYEAKASEQTTDWTRSCMHTLRWQLMRL